VRSVYHGMLVSANFFDVLGVVPALGRTFRPDEGQVPGRDAVVVLSDSFWTNVLGRDPSILDGVVWMNGIDLHVVGITSPSFTGTDPVLQPAFYIPLMMTQRLGAQASSPQGREAVDDPVENRAKPFVFVKGRLKPGASNATGRAELNAIWNQ